MMKHRSREPSINVWRHDAQSTTVHTNRISPFAHIYRIGYHYLWVKIVTVRVNSVCQAQAYTGMKTKHHASPVQ